MVKYIPSQRRGIYLTIFDHKLLMTEVEGIIYVNAPYRGYGTYVMYCSYDILVNPSNFRPISVQLMSNLALVLSLSISHFQPP